MLTSSSQTDDSILARGQKAKAQRKGQLQIAAKTLAVFAGQVADEVHVHLLIDGKSMGTDLTDLFHDLGGIAADKEEVIPAS